MCADRGPMQSQFSFYDRSQLMDAITEHSSLVQRIGDTLTWREQVRATNTETERLGELERKLGIDVEGAVGAVDVDTTNVDVLDTSDGGGVVVAKAESETKTDIPDTDATEPHKPSATYLGSERNE